MQTPVAIQHPPVERITLHAVGVAVFVAQGEGRLRESNTLYLKGGRLLQAEIDAYQNRLNDAWLLRQVRLL